MNPDVIRFIKHDDAQQTLEVYRPYIENTVISFEYEAPSLNEWLGRIESFTPEHPWLVYESKSEVVGYAYATKHKTRTAYVWSVDSAVYVKEEFHGSGAARKLYSALFEILKIQGYINVYAGVTLPNVKSEKFHESFGFKEVGVYQNVGYKLGAWRDVRWYALGLTEHKESPAMPVPLSAMNDDERIQSILENTNKM